MPTGSPHFQAKPVGLGFSSICTAEKDAADQEDGPAEIYVEGETGGGTESAGAASERNGYDYRSYSG